MKFWVTVLIFFVCFISAGATDSRTLEINLADQFDGVNRYDLSANFMDSDNWIYGQTGDGLPVYRQTFSVPCGTTPQIVDISFAALDNTQTFALEDIQYFSRTTASDNDYDPDLFGKPEFETFDGIQLALQKKYSTSDYDYYDLLIAPFQTAEYSNICKPYNDLEVELVLLQSDHSTLNTNQINRDMNRILDCLSGVKNRTDFGSAISQLSEYPQNPDYIVITADSLAEALAPFVHWKRSLGFNCQIKSVEEIEVQYSGLDLAEQIREYLKDAYQNGAEWVLLGGDETIIPVRCFYPANTNTEIPMEYLHASDLYYADLTGDWDVDGDGVWGEPYHDNPDLQPELFVGRVPSNSVYEISCWIEKTINYENGGVLQDAEYVGRALITSADQMRDWNYGQGQDSLIAQYFPASLAVDLNSIQEFPSGVDPSPTQAPARTFVEHFSEGWNFSAILAHGTCGGFVTMSSGYNEWPKTYVWVGDGTSSEKGYLDDLENYGQAGVVYSVACSQGALDYDQPPISAQNPCVGEYLINLENRGAAAFIGYSRYGWVATSYKLTEDFVEYIYQVDNRLGPANTFSKLMHTNQRDLNYGLNLFGDPALPMWTAQPLPLTATHPDIIQLGNNVIDIEITSDGQPVSEALVTVINTNDNLFMGESGMDGTLELDFNTGIDSMITLTVTRPGFMPFQINLSTSIALDADDDTDNRPQIPESFELYQNYPNPANPSTRVGFYLPQEDNVSLELYNVLGQKVYQVDEFALNAGYHEIDLDLSEYSSGVYFYRVITAEQVETKKLMLLK